jgi:hypothetical protein
MGATTCHPPASEGELTARDVVLRVIGVKRLAAWCDVSVHAPYQWLSRGDGAVAIPASYAATIIKAARAEGIDFDIGLFWPDLRGLVG